MKIILRSDVDGVGKQGDVVVVADGFARNHLVPKGLAHLATPGAERQAEKTREKRQLQDAKEREDAQEMAGRLSSTALTISARASANKLFGSISVTDIVQATSEQLNITLKSKMVELSKPLRTVGEHQISVNLHEDVQAQVTVEIVATED